MRKELRVVLVFAVIVPVMFVLMVCRDALANDKPISMSLKNADIQDALRMLAEQNNLNIIASDDVKGKITVKFTNVTLEEALDSIVTINKFVYTRTANTIRVTTREAAKKEPLTTEVFTLKNVKSKGLKEALDSAVSKDGSMNTHEESNSLIVTDYPTNIEKVRAIVGKIDAQIPQVKITAKIIETTLTDDERLGIDWGLKATGFGAVRPTIAPFRSLEKNQTYYPNLEAGTVTSTTDSSGAGTVGVATTLPRATADDFIFGKLDFSQFRVILEMLEERGNTEILSSPHVVATDNSRAEIVVGQSVPIPTYTYNNERGVWAVTGYTEQKIGITLEVTPRIVSGNDIILDIKPKISDIIGYTGPNNERPITSTREATTQVRLRSGEVVMIGGLLKEKKIDGVKRVPVLGRIPILGFFFSKKTKSKEKTDLLIFVSAEILK